MARRTFFSFHYKNDVQRAHVVRNSWVTKPNTEAAGFLDAADFEKVQREGDTAVHNWIKKQLEGTTVTVVLIGSETSTREYVKYELEQSYLRGNGMLGIYVHNINGFDGKPSTKGSNQFGPIGKTSAGVTVYFSTDYPCYDWANDKGYENLGKWIEEAAKKASK